MALGWGIQGSSPTPHGAGALLGLCPQKGPCPLGDRAPEKHQQPWVFSGNIRTRLSVQGTEFRRHSPSGLCKSRVCTWVGRGQRGRVDKVALASPRDNWGLAVRAGFPPEPWASLVLQAGVFQNPENPGASTCPAPQIACSFGTAWPSTRRTTHSPKFELSFPARLLGQSALC